MAAARLTVEYDGSGFAGWARQPGLRTVQGTLEQALRALRGGRDGVELTVAGRTDRGVHAGGGAGAAPPRVRAGGRGGPRPPGGGRGGRGSTPFSPPTSSSWPPSRRP